MRFMAKESGSGQVGLVGRAVRRIDAQEKIRGTARYSADFALPGMVYGRIVRSVMPAARLISVDISQALSVPGVVAVLTAKDVPQNCFWIGAVGGQGTHPHLVFAEEVVRYVGEPVALVIAETEAAAYEAAELVDIDYVPANGLFDPVAALAPDAPAIHTERANLLQSFRVRRGDVQAAFRDADVVVEGVYQTQHVDPCYLEPPAGVAWIDEQNVLTLRMGTQVLDHTRQIADVLQLPLHKVRITAPYMGGGFGGKEELTIEVYLGLMAWATRRPSRLTLTRQELLVAGTKRHPFRMSYRTGATRDGRIIAQQVEIIADAGAYACLSPRVIFVAMLSACGPYAVPSVAVDARAVYTNNVPTSAMRGFGAMQMVMGYEGQMDRVAEALGMDPLVLRRRNFIQKGDLHITGQLQKTAVLLPEMLDRVVKETDSGRYAPSGPTRRIGQGIACFMKHYGLPLVAGRDTAEVSVGMLADGTVTVRAGVTDIGAGQVSTVAQIAAHVLGVPYEDVTVYFGDSATMPRIGPTAASRMTLMAGNAARVAAEQVRDRLIAVAASMLQAPASDVALQGGRAMLSGVPEQSLPLSQVIARCRAQGITLEALGSYVGPDAPPFDFETGQGDAVIDFAFAVHGAVLEVDDETGALRLLDYVAAHDVGRAIDPTQVEGQIEGGVAQGIGQVLMEDCCIREGVVNAGAMFNYLAPTSADLPDIRPFIFESLEGAGPFGARGVGEIPIAGPLGAIPSAVAALTGNRPLRLPVTPDDVLASLKQRRT